MPRFRIKGLDAQGRLAEREVVAATVAEAGQSAREAGLHVVQVAEPAGLSGSRRKDAFDLALFAHELLALLGAGLSLIEALEALEERQLERDGSSRLLADLLRQMREGRPFSQALQQHPEFPELFVASIAASEQTGEMVDALQRYLRYHEQVSLLRERIVSASIYPALLLVVGAGVALFLLCYLVPRFSHVYDGMATELPLASRLLMEWGQFAGRHAWAVSAGAIALGTAVVLVFRDKRVQQLLLARVQTSGWLGPRLRLLQLSRFYRSLGLLLRGGISVPRALQMTGPLLTSPDRLRLEAALQAVTRGMALSDSLKAEGLSTPVALRLLRAGERNGQLAVMLERVADFHDREVAQWIDRVARVFEPVLMLLIGAVIGGIVVLLYLPIFELAGSLQ